MKKQSSWLSVFAVGLIALAAIVSFVRVINGNSREQAATPEMSSLRAVVIAEEPGQPGKFVYSTRDSMVFGSFQCEPEDASIAWITLEDRNRTFCTGASFTKATDDKGKPVAFIGTTRGPVYLLRIERGFAVKPKYIDAVLTLEMPQQPLRNFTVRLTKIAEPKRYLEPLTGKAAEQADRLAIAEVPYERGGISVRTASPLPQGESLNTEILRTSFSPTGRDSGTYGSDSDLAEVRLSRYKLEQSAATLRYKDAQITEINGVFTLRFPMTQLVGTVAGYSAQIARYLPVPKSGTKHSESHGDLFVELKRTPNTPDTSRINAPLGSPTLSFQGISPSIEDLGLASIRLRIAGSAQVLGFDQTVKSHGPVKHPISGLIPDLKLKLGICQPVLVNSTTVVLPVNHPYQKATATKKSS